MMHTALCLGLPVFLITCQTLASVANASLSTSLDDYGYDVIPSSSPSLTLSLLQTKFSFHSGATRVDDDLSQVGHVISRRLLAADILRHPGEHDDEVESYARHYHELFLQSSMIFFLHVSKSAGTTLCHAGLVSGCRTSAANCHTYFDEELWGPHNNGPLADLQARKIAMGPDTCAGLSAKYAALNITLEGNENYLVDEGLCSEFWNVMVAREPVKRLMSHLSMLSNPELEYTRHPELADPEHLPNSSVVFERFPTLSNNYYIRVLLGAEVFALPFGSITSAHLEKAKRILEAFDVMLVTEDNEDTSLGDDIKATLGLDADVVQNGGSTASYIQDLNWTNTSWESVRAANDLDFKLWQHARHLHAIDRQVFRHPAFSKVSAAMPRASCGYLAK